MYGQLLIKLLKINRADSTHPHHNPVLSYGRIKTGEDVEIKTSNERRHLNISGAIEINSQDVITRSSDRVNASSICILQKVVRDKKQFEKNIMLIMDNYALQPISESKKHWPKI